MSLDKTFPRYHHRSRIFTLPNSVKKKLWFRALLSSCNRFSQNSKRKKSFEDFTDNTQFFHKKFNENNNGQKLKYNFIQGMDSENSYDDCLNLKHRTSSVCLNESINETSSFINSIDGKLIFDNSNEINKSVDDEYKKIFTVVNFPNQYDRISRNLEKKSQNSPCLRPKIKNKKIKLKENGIILKSESKANEAYDHIKYNKKHIEIVECTNPKDFKCPLKFTYDSNSSDDESLPFLNIKSFKKNNAIINDVNIKTDENHEESEVDSYYTISENSYCGDIENEESFDKEKSLKINKQINNLKWKRKDNAMSFHIKKTRQVILVLRYPMEIALKGIVKVQSLKDSVMIFGYKLDITKPPIRVFSSRWFRYFSMQTNPPILNKNWETDLAIKLEKIQPNLFSVMKPSLSEDSIVIMLTLEEFKQIEFTDLLGMKNFPTVSKCYAESIPNIRKLNIGDCYHYITKIMNDAINISEYQSNKAPKILICGGKNSGKSTMLRYLINNSLNTCTKCFHLEADVGQTEFTPPGCIALTCINSPIFGPPFTHLKNPEKMYFLGSVTVHIPEDYLTAVSNFFDYYDKKFSEYPLFINTMGWTKDIGIALLIDIIHIIQPTHIIQLNFENDRLNYPSLTENFVFETDGWKFTKSMKTLQKYDLIEMPSPASVRKNVEPAKYRTLAILSYLGKLQSNFTLEFEPINSFTPYVISWSAVYLYICNDYAPLNQILYAFNGNWVALCTVTNLEIYDIDSELKILKHAHDNICHGFGIIRGIDPIKKLFYLITPEPPECLQSVNALLKGHINLPEKLFIMQNGNSVPYVNHHLEVNI